METFDMVPASVGAGDGGLGIVQMEETEDHEGVEMWSKLRDGLQERIIARLPFFKLFQVPVLSRAWRVAFRSPIFQDEVTTVSHRWPIYCPVHLSRERLVGYDAAAQRWEKLFPLSFLPYVPQGYDGVRSCSGAGSLICFARRNKNKEREMFRVKQRTSPISTNCYLQLLHAEEAEKARQNRRPLGPGRGNNLPREGVFPPYHPRSEGYHARIQDFRRRLEEFCMADSVDDELSQETKDLHAYIDASLARSFPTNLGVGEAFDMYVTNVVTKEWKELPSRPCMERPDIVQLVAVGTSAYKLILMTLLKQGSLEATEGLFRVQIYDSRTGAWTLRSSPTAICSLKINTIESVVYLDSEGVLFMIVGESEVLYEILAYNVEDDSWTRIPHPVVLSNHEFLICGLVVCGSDVMLVTGSTESRDANLDPGLVGLGYTGKIKLLVYRLEIELMSFVLFSRGPSPGSVKGVSNVDFVVGAGDCVYLGLRGEPSKPSLVFNIRQKLWSTLAPANKSWLCTISRTTKFPFQPGLNPFLNLRTELGGSAPDAGRRGDSAAADAGELSGSANRRPSTDMEDVD